VASTTPVTIVSATVAGTSGPWRSPRGGLKVCTASRQVLRIAFSRSTRVNGKPMKTFESFDGLTIAYQEWGEQGSGRPPVVLHHGFVANAEANWVAPGVIEALLAAGHAVVAPDARGHGASDKPHEPSRYGEQQMARDLATLLEVIGAPEVDLVGYSMGAVVALIYASGAGQPLGQTTPGRVRRLVVGGVGSGVVECGGVDRRVISNDAIIEALRVQDAGTLADGGASAFRRLADALGADREALVAQASSIFRGEIPLGRIAAPTLVLAGDSDPLAVRPEVLVAAIPNATLGVLSGDHMQAVADPGFAESIVDFVA
jgi:pimeloyl-ACP methyl ester carboxylesterase